MASLRSRAAIAAGMALALISSWRAIYIADYMVSTARYAGDDLPLLPEPTTESLTTTTLQSSRSVLHARILHLLPIFPNDIPWTAPRIDRVGRLLRIPPWTLLDSNAHQTVALAVLGINASCPSNSYDLSPDTYVLFLAWSQEPCKEEIASHIQYVHLGAHDRIRSRTHARNLLYSLLVKEEMARKAAFLYHIFADDSVLMQLITSDGAPDSPASEPRHWNFFIAWLLKELPLIGVPLSHRMSFTPANETSWTTYFDSDIVALAPRARQYLLPWDDSLEVAHQGEFHPAHVQFVIETFFLFCQAPLQCPGLRVFQANYDAILDRRLSMYPWCYNEALDSAISNLKAIFGRSCTPGKVVFQLTGARSMFKGEVGWHSKRMPRGTLLRRNNQTNWVEVSPRRFLPFGTLTTGNPYGDCGGSSALDPYYVHPVPPPLSLQSSIPHLLRFSITGDASKVKRLLPVLDAKIKDRNGAPDQRDFHLPLCRDVLVAFFSTGMECPMDLSVREAPELPDVAFFFLGWKTKCTEARRLFNVHYVYEKGGTWTTARNRMYEILQQEEKSRGCSFLYHVYVDDDVNLFTVWDHRRQPQPAKREAPIRVITDWLYRELPLIAFPFVSAGRIEAQTRWMTVFDAMFTILSPRARQYLLPYDAHRDDETWWYSNSILNAEAFFIFPQAPVRCPVVGIFNYEHNNYPRMFHYSHMYKTSALDAVRNIATRFGQKCDLGSFYWQFEPGDYHLVLALQDKIRDPRLPTNVLHEAAPGSPDLVSSDRFVPFASTVFTKCYKGE